MTNDSILRENIINAVKNVELGPLTVRRKYNVEINSRRYPIKQVISMVTGLKLRRLKSQGGYSENRFQRRYYER